MLRWLINVFSVLASVASLVVTLSNFLLFFCFLSRRQTIHISDMVGIPSNNHIWRYFWFWHWKKFQFQLFNLFLLACKLCKSGLELDIMFQTQPDLWHCFYWIVYNAGTLILRVCYFFSYFGVSINCRSWAFKLRNIFLTCAENKAICLGAFCIAIYEN